MCGQGAFLSLAVHHQGSQTRTSQYIIIELYRIITAFPRDLSNFGNSEAFIALSGLLLLHFLREPGRAQALAWQAGLAPDNISGGIQKYIVPLRETALNCISCELCAFA